MPREQDAALHLVPPPGRAWSFPGGDEDDESVTLFFAVRTPDGGARYTVRLPITTDGLTLVVGTPEVTEAD